MRAWSGVEDRRSGRAGRVCLVACQRARVRRGAASTCAARACDCFSWFGASSVRAARRFLERRGITPGSAAAQRSKAARSSQGALGRVQPQASGGPVLERCGACWCEFAGVWVGHGTGFGDCPGPFGRDRKPCLRRHHGRGIVAEPECGCFHAVECAVFAVDGQSRCIEWGGGNGNQRGRGDGAAGRDRSGACGIGRSQRRVGFLLRCGPTAIDRRGPDLVADRKNPGPGGRSWIAGLFPLWARVFAGFAWSTTNVQLVVAAVGQAYEGTLVNALQSSASYEGLYWSSDGGATWHLGRITDLNGADVQGPLDGFVLPDGNAATSVVWNPVRKVFVAAVRYHGYYQSTDGMNWTQMPLYPNGQPGGRIHGGQLPHPVRLGWRCGMPDFPWKPGDQSAHRGHLRVVGR